MIILSKGLSEHCTEPLFNELADCEIIFRERTRCEALIGTVKVWE